MTLRPNWRKSLLVLVAAGLLISLASPWWLPFPALWLVDSDAPQKVDAIVVLAGDGYGRRIQAGAELARQGYAPVVLANGNNNFYGIWEGEAAIDFAVHHGQPRELFQPFNHTATSTDEEMQQLFRFARSRGWNSLMIVTSDYHTRRTRILARRNLPNGMSVIVFAAPDKYFQADRWWWHRESRKILLTEWLKMGAVALGGL